MAEPSSDRWEIWGYALWAIGILLFAIAAARDRDLLSFIASVLFLIGIVVVMVPMIPRDRPPGS